MKVGAIIQIAEILSKHLLPSDRKINLTEYRSGKWTLSFMDNAAQVHYYDILHDGSVVEADRG